LVNHEPHFVTAVFQVDFDELITPEGAHFTKDARMVSNYVRLETFHVSFNGKLGLAPLGLFLFYQLLDSHFHSELDFGLRVSHRFTFLLTRLLIRKSHFTFNLGLALSEEKKILNLFGLSCDLFLELFDALHNLV
jgi:hypothetical protein